MDAQRAAVDRKGPGCAKRLGRYRARPHAPALPAADGRPRNRRRTRGAACPIGFSGRDGPRAPHRSRWNSTALGLSQGALRALPGGDPAAAGLSRRTRTARRSAAGACQDDGVGRPAAVGRCTENGAAIRHARIGGVHRSAAGGRHADAGIRSPGGRPRIRDATPLCRQQRAAKSVRSAGECRRGVSGGARSSVARRAVPRGGRLPGTAVDGACAARRNRRVGRSVLPHRAHPGAA